MKEQFIRTAMLLGEEGIRRLAGKRVAVFGIGGVGGHVAEALARSGIGALDLIDNDVVNVSNINRQIIALYDTVGQYKTRVMAERIARINPDCKVTVYETFYLPEEREKFPFEQFDYIADAIDTVTAKIDLAVTAEKMGIPIISCMGTGNKLDPTQLEVTDIYKTSVCPLAKVMRRELKARNVKALKVVYSREQALTPLLLTSGEETTAGCTEQVKKAVCMTDGTEQVKEPENGARHRAVPGSTAFVPAVAGLILAGEVIRDLAGGKGEQ